MLENKKSKIIAFITAVWAITGLMLGKIQPENAWQMILAAGAVWGLWDKMDRVGKSM